MGKRNNVVPVEDDVYPCTVAYCFEYPVFFDLLSVLSLFLFLLPGIAYEHLQTDLTRYFLYSILLYVHQA